MAGGWWDEVLSGLGFATPKHASPLRHAGDLARGVTTLFTAPMTAPLAMASGVDWGKLGQWATTDPSSKPGRGATTAQGPSLEDLWYEYFRKLPGVSEADARQAAKDKLMLNDPKMRDLAQSDLNRIDAQRQQSQTASQMGYTPEALAKIAQVRSASDSAAFEMMARLQDQWGADIANRMPGFAKDLVSPAPGAGMGNLTRQLMAQQQTYDLGMPERVMRDAVSKASYYNTDPVDAAFGVNSSAPSSSGLSPQMQAMMLTPPKPPST